MLSNIFLFTGNEKYLLFQELKRWTDGFIQKYGIDSFLSYKTDDFDLESLRQVLYSGGLFVQKRMVVVYGFPLDGDSSNKLSASIVQQFSEEFMQRQGNITAETILIFVSFKPDKRTKFYTFLKKELDPKTGIKEFGFLKPYELKQFVRQKTPSLKWSESVLDSFLTKTGVSLLHIQNEVDKLLLFAEEEKTSEILEKHVNLITFAMGDINNFTFFDILLSDKKKAMKLVASIQEDGLNRNAFAGNLYWGFRIWLFVLDCFEQNIKDSKTIASILKVNPFNVSKALKNIDLLSCNKNGIISFYRGLIELDSDIKEGKKSDMVFWLEVKKMIYNL